MRKFIAIFVLLLFLMSIFCSYMVIKWFENTTREQYESLLKIATENIKYDDSMEMKSVKENDVIGILEIEKLGIEAPVKEGTTTEILKYSIGHFTESDAWDGNIAFASHNRGSYAHYFEKINQLEYGDEISYTTNLGKRVYSVIEKEIIEETDWEKVLERKENNTITLVTCITDKKNCRFCIKAVEI